MPELYPARVWTRTRWKEVRDKENVSSGAVAGVNMGDLLDKFEAANKQGVREGLVAAKKLKTGIAKYKTGIKKKNKELHDRIEKYLEYNVDCYIKDVEGIVDAIPDYNKFRQAASEAVTEGMRQLLEAEQQGATGGFKPTNIKAAGKALSDFGTCAQRMMYVHDSVDPTVCKKLDRAIYTLEGAEEWHKKMVMALVDQLNQLPVKI